MAGIQSEHNMFFCESTGLVMITELELKLAALSTVIVSLRFYDQCESREYYEKERRDYIEFNRDYPPSADAITLFYQNNRIRMEIADLKDKGLVFDKTNNSFETLLNQASKLHTYIATRKGGANQSTLITTIIDNTIDLLLQKKPSEEYIKNAKVIQDSDRSEPIEQQTASRGNLNLKILGGLMLALGVAFIITSGVAFLCLGTAGVALGVNSGVTGVATVMAGMFFFKEGRAGERPVKSTETLIEPNSCARPI